jgi:ribosome recycling factor
VAEDQTEKTPAVHQIQKDVKDAVNNASDGGVQSSSYKDLVEAVAGKIKEERVQLLVKGFNKYEEAAKELTKVDRPDNIPRDRNGKELKEQGTYSKERSDAIAKQEGLVKKITTAMDKAILDADYTKLKELVK